MATPHVHAELIKAWADGAEIEVRDSSDEDWRLVISYPQWSPSCQYRVKPEAPQVKWLWAYKPHTPTKRWTMDDTFLSESEAKSYFSAYPEIMKLEWTRTEFPV